MKYLEAQFRELFLAGTKWIDVRAPIEFAAGSIPGAVNLPLLTDEERHEIGLTYKQSGQEAAIALGHQFVGGATKEARIQSWLLELEIHPEAVIYCFRGGLRSQIVQQWLKERGVQRPIIAGGYKALRKFLLESLDLSARELNFEVVSGPTGSGKTDYIRASGRPYVDLEAIAEHRGSAFGSRGPQPNQVDFENLLALELLHLLKFDRPILIEDESRRIGQRAIPDGLFQKMQASPKLQLDIPLDVRIENIFRDYVLNSSLGEQGDSAKFDDFRRSVKAISRRLGGLRAQELLSDLDFSQSEFTAGRGLESNRIWIGKLLHWYYDPLYSGSVSSP